MNKAVKKVLIDQDMTIADLARKIGYGREHLSAVIHGRVESERAQKVIALALGKDFSELWQAEPGPKDLSPEHN